MGASGNSEAGKPGRIDGIKVESIPLPLRQARIWVCWAWDGDTKPPVDPQTGEHAKGWQRRENALTFAEALAAWQANRERVDGIGVVYSDERLDALLAVCVDLDACRNPETGELSPWGQAILEDLGTYSEVSPSGTGAKAFGWLLGEISLPNGKGHAYADIKGEPEIAGKKPKVEVFLRSGYCTMTGERLPITPTDLHPIDGPLLDLLKRLPFGGKQAARKGGLKGKAESWRGTTVKTPRMGAGRPDAEERARIELRDHVDPAISGQGGHARLLWAAQVVVRGYLVPEETAFRLLSEVYNPRCVPEWSEAEIRHKIKEAKENPLDKYPDGWKLDGRENEQQSNHQSNGQAPPHKDAAGSPKTGWVYAPITSAQLLDETRPPEWIVKGISVRGQPGIIGGPLKGMKTSVAIDYAVSVASGEPLLGKFEVPTPRRVMVILGEGGRWGILQKARAVAAGRGLRLRELSLIWQFDLPSLARPDDVEALAEGLARDGIEVLLVDPLYLCFLSGGVEASASNFFQTGPILRLLFAACQKAGCDLFIVHHSTRPMARAYEPMQIADLAYSGPAEFAGQWLLLNRREPFAQDEPSKLWLTTGGRDFGGGLWAIDADEGTHTDDFSGRRWCVEVREASEARAGEREARQQEKESRADRVIRSNGNKILDSLDRLNESERDKKRPGRFLSQSSVAADAGLNTDSFNRAAAALKRELAIELLDKGEEVRDGDQTTRLPWKGIRRPLWQARRGG